MMCEALVSLNLFCAAQDDRLFILHFSTLSISPEFFFIYRFFLSERK